MRHVVMFSGGVGSYAAAKRVVAEFGADDTTLLFANTRMEDEDLYRFLWDAQAKLGAEMVVISDGRDPWELFRESRFMGNSRVDLCSRVLKRELMDKWVEARYSPDDVRCYVGIDWNEEHRFIRMAQRKLPYVYLAPMLEPPLLLKEEMLAEVEADGITIPRLYKLGFSHNNCGGFCVKAGVGHFKTLYEQMPERYAVHEAQERGFQEFIGKPVTILRRQRDGVRRSLSLTELREEFNGSMTEEQDDVGGCGCIFEPDEGSVSSQETDA